MCPSTCDNVTEMNGPAEVKIFNFIAQRQMFVCSLYFRVQ